ncbi:type II secretion system F family protein [Candidatus Woesearchaeota archaeon]|nr:type II secretion system F family protein [Candidatus Woesearchaeota archaeon]
MTKASERLKKLREEKEKLKEISKVLKSKNRQTVQKIQKKETKENIHIPIQPRTPEQTQSPVREKIMHGETMPPQKKAETKRSLKIFDIFRRKKQGKKQLDEKPTDRPPEKNMGMPHQQSISGEKPKEKKRFLLFKKKKIPDKNTQEETIQVHKPDIKKMPESKQKHQKPEHDEKKHEIKKKKKEKKTSYEQRKIFSNFIKKAGIDSNFASINKKILLVVAIFSIISSIYLGIDSALKGSFVFDALALVASVAVFGGAAVFLVMWLLFFIYIDFKIYQRRKEIEAVFPDFLQLTAANINAGMPIDRALWFAIRPRFGILAKEMETVAKATMVGENLPKALQEFTARYDSPTITRAINLLLEGLESGGEIGDLLSKVATNIRETELLKKEMASSVTTYVIFILFATIGAAPFLFGLTTELIVIMQAILSDISVGEGGQSMGGMGSFAMSGDSISITDYRIFAITSVIISSVFAAIITSVIQKGNAKESLKNIPVYVLISLANYFISFSLLNLFLSGFFV